MGRLLRRDGVESDRGPWIPACGEDDESCGHGDESCGHGDESCGHRDGSCGEDDNLRRFYYLRSFVAIPYRDDEAYQYYRATHECGPLRDLVNAR